MRPTRKFLACRWGRWLVPVLLCLIAVRVSADAGADFELTALDGSSHRLSDHRGSFVIVNFWATWCSPCLRELPALEAFARANPEVVVLTVNFEVIEADALREFVRRIELALPVLRVGDAPLVPFEPLKGLPTTAIVSPDGTVIALHAGEVTRDALERFLSLERAR